MTSPGRARSPDSSQPVRHDADAGGGDEHAVGLAALDHLGVAGDDLHARLARRRAHALRDALQIGERKPSSRMKLADRCSGFAPAMARSLTVPCTASEPMSPPGKNSGETT